MTINFNCQSCKKKIKAKETAGGKWGNCPHCNLKCYIPMPPASEEEEIKLVPLEEEEKKRYEEKMTETNNLQLKILHETADPGNAIGFSFTQQDEKKLWKYTITYLRQIADGELDQAQQTAETIIPYGGHAKEILAKIARSEEPEPELADISNAVLKGLIKNLNEEINKN